MAGEMPVGLRPFAGEVVRSSSFHLISPDKYQYLGRIMAPNIVRHPHWVALRAAIRCESIPVGASFKEGTSRPEQAQVGYPHVISLGRHIILLSLPTLAGSMVWSP